jgi:hypothetical protein
LCGATSPPLPRRAEDREVATSGERRAASGERSVTIRNTGSGALELVTPGFSPRDTAGHDARRGCRDDLGVVRRAPCAAGLRVCLNVLRQTAQRRAGDGSGAQVVLPSMVCQQTANIGNRTVHGRFAGGYPV